VHLAVKVFVTVAYLLYSKLCTVHRFVFWQHYAKFFVFMLDR